MNEMSLIQNIGAMIIMIIAPFIKVNKRFWNYLLIIPIVPAVYFTIITQYWYKDHEGNFAGMLILSGVMAFVILCEIYKALMPYEARIKYGYIVTLGMTVCLSIGVATALKYNAKVYAIAMCIFVLLCFIPGKILESNFIFWGVSVGTLIGSYLMYIISNGVHNGLWIISNKFGVVVFAMFSVLFIISVFKYKNRASNSIIQKMSTSAVIVCLITAVFDRYIISIPFCFFYLIFALCSSNTSNVCEVTFDVKTYFIKVKNNGKLHFCLSFIAMLPIVISVLLLSPLEIFQSNRYEFKFDYKQIFGWYIVLAFAICFIIGIISVFITEETFRLFTSIISTISVLFYIQYMFWNIKVTVVDGGPFDFNAIKEYTRYNLLFWILFGAFCTILLYIIKERWKSVVIGVSIFLSIVQITAIFSLIFNLMCTPGPSHYYFSGKNQYEIGKKENIIFIILDTYSRNDLEQVLIKYPDTLDVMKDFTYYPNASSEYTSTFPSIPHMLTGYNCPDSVGYDKEVNRIKWLKEAWNTDKCVKFYDKLHSNGYSVNVYSEDTCYTIGAYDDIKKYIDNAERAEGYLDVPRIIMLLTKMSTYRYVPYIIKPHFEVLSYEFNSVVSYNQNDCQTRDSDIYTSISENGLTVSEDKEKTVKIQHSFGMHRPFSYDENCRLLPDQDGNVSDNGRGLFVYVDEYIKCLKSLGMYDSSTIFVMADHGPSSMDPIFFVKRKNESHSKYITNEKDVLYSDIQEMVIDIIDNENVNETNINISYND